jgi:hypothetical protein
VLADEQQRRLEEFGTSRPFEMRFLDKAELRFIDAIDQDTEPWGDDDVLELEFENENLET